MKRLIALLFVVISTNVMAEQSNTNEVCKVFSDKLKEINAQAPIGIDYLTTLVGSSAFYSKPNCYISFAYLTRRIYVN